jgi:hypothetical protein
MCRNCDSRGNRSDHIAFAAIMTVVPMYSHAEYYRGRAIVAQQRAAQTTDLSLKEALKDIARHWLMLAERVVWLDRQHNRPAEPNHIQRQ